MHTDRRSEIWGGVTDPAKHNPDSFRYLVHTFVSESQRGWWKSVHLQIRKDDAAKGLVNSADGDQGIDLLSRPEGISGRLCVAASIIDDKHLGT